VSLDLHACDLASAPHNGATFVSAYSGCGGLDIGFRVAGFVPIWANDIDAIALESYERILGPHALAGEIDRVEWPARGSADVVIGGPPCQGFSVAGKMNPGDPRSKHVDRFLDLVEHVQPAAFVMENVKTLGTSTRWTAVREQLTRRAKRLGYSPSMIILNAADFGTPQRRERLFLIGVRGGAPPETLDPESRVHMTVRQALDRLPPFGEEGNNTLCSAGVTPAKRPVLRPTAFRGSLLFNGNGRPLRLDSTAPTLPASMGGNATPIIDQFELETGAESWVVQYHRRLLEGGKPLKRAPKHLRRVTVEEAAQIQGFPLEMEFAGSKSAKYRQIGNAVPPPLAFAVARAVADAIGIPRRERSETLAA
jgi:DNA (cytosine-5)-methyltransferase 1